MIGCQHQRALDDPEGDAGPLLAEAFTRQQEPGDSGQQQSTTAGGGDAALTGVARRCS
jgi:hypothetical protein